MQVVILLGLIKEDVLKYIITGASSGIGKRCAERLLEKGNECLLLARSENKLQEIKNGFSEKATIRSIDLSKIELIEELFDEVKEMFPFDGMVHCAGIAPLKRVDENDIVTLRQTYEINVFSFVELMRCFVKEGVCNDGASVVVMSSVAAHRGSNRQVIYSGSKAALEGSVRCMARELIGRKIRVNSVVSGAVETELLQQLRLESANLDERMKRYYPLGIIPIEKVCAMIEYLLSDTASHITGNSLPIDAGYLL